MGSHTIVARRSCFPFAIEQSKPHPISHHPEPILFHTHRHTAIAMKTIYTVAIVTLLSVVSQCAPITEYGSVAEYNIRKPNGYSAFSYNVEQNTGGVFRVETRSPDGRVVGSYGIRDANGQYRTVRYVADELGYRASISSNEPGLSEAQPADVLVAKTAPRSASKSYAPSMGAAAAPRNNDHTARAPLPLTAMYSADQPGVRLKSVSAVPSKQSTDKWPTDQVGVRRLSDQPKTREESAVVPSQYTKQKWRDGHEADVRRTSARDWSTRKRPLVAVHPPRRLSYARPLFELRVPTGGARGARTPDPRSRPTTNRRSGIARLPADVREIPSAEELERRRKGQNKKLKVFCYAKAKAGETPHPRADYLVRGGHPVLDDDDRRPPHHSASGEPAMYMERGAEADKDHVNCHAYAWQVSGGNPRGLVRINNPDQAGGGDRSNLPPGGGGGGGQAYGPRADRPTTAELGPHFDPNLYLAGLIWPSE